MNYREFNSMKNMAQANINNMNNNNYNYNPSSNTQNNNNMSGIVQQVTNMKEDGNNLFIKFKTQTYNSF